MLLICGDPGLATGITALGYDEHTPARMLFHATCAEEEVASALDYCRDALPGGSEARMVLERFDLHMNKRDVDLTAKLVQGRMTAWAEQNEVPIVWQMPPEKDSVTREVLVNLGLWVPGYANRHIMDANRHGVMYLQRALHMPTIRKGWPE